MRGVVFTADVGQFGSLSGKVYAEGDCKIFRFRYLSDSYHTGPMGQGDNNGGSNKPDKEWTYPTPGAGDERILQSVCSR